MVAIVNWLRRKVSPAIGRPRKRIKSLAPAPKPEAPRLVRIEGDLLVVVADGCEYFVSPITGELHYAGPGERELAFARLLARTSLKADPNWPRKYKPFYRNGENGRELFYMWQGRAFPATDPVSIAKVVTCN